MMQPIRVVFADDHPVVRRGLVMIVDIEDDIEVVGEAENGEQAISLAHQLQPDVILMDLQMPVLGGVDATRRIRAELPHIKIIILTTFADDEHIYEGVAAGARGYLLKDAPPDDLIEAIRAAYQGKSLIDPGVAAKILERFSSLVNQPFTPVTKPLSPTPTKPISPPNPTMVKLTPRELEVLHLLAQGARNKQIAEKLIIAPRTVKVHVGNILGKLGVSNRTEAVAAAMKLGLLQ